MPAVRTYALSLGAMLVPALAQFALFAFYARALGVEQYGIYIALVSWSPICFELVGWGGGEYLIKRTAQERSAFPVVRAHLAKMMLVTLPGAIALFCVLTLSIIGHAVNFTTILAIGISEFAGMRLLVNAEQSAIALGRMGLANSVRMMQALPRLGGVLIAYFALAQTGLEALAIAGSMGVLLAGLVVRAIEARALPRLGPLRLQSDGLRDGGWFMSLHLLRAGQGNIDRIVLSALVDPATLALYGAAQRFVQIGMLPLQAVMRLTYPGFFRAGSGGIGRTLGYAIKVLPMALGAAATAALGLVVLSPAIPLLVGEDYTLSVSYLAYLAPILPIFALNAVAADTLSGAGHLMVRTVLAAAGIGVQALAFIVLHEGHQIVLASFLGAAATGILSAVTIVILLRRRRGQPVPSTP